MTKLDFYNAVVKMYNNTGHGVPGKLLRKKLSEINCEHIIGELINEGSL